MSIYRRGGNFFVYVPQRDGRRVIKTTSTGDRSTARAMDAMLSRMASQRRWEFLDAIEDGRLSVATVFDADASNTLEWLSGKLKDVDLRNYLTPWSDSVRSTTSRTSDTAQQYLTKVRTLIKDDGPFYSSQLEYSVLTSWLVAQNVSGSTKRKYRAAMASFCEYLRAAGVIASNPVRAVKAPKANPPRMRYLEMKEIRTLIAAHSEPHRTLSALLHGTGIEISVALSLRCSDVDRTRMEVRARGTKTHSRDRIALIAGWAWPFIQAHIATLLPNAPLFPHMDRWRALDAHKEACKAVGIENYRLHDCRHSYATIAIRAGAPFEVVAKQLGHVNTQQVIACYGRFVPNAAERRAWEAVAAAQEEEARRAS